MFRVIMMKMMIITIIKGKMIGVRMILIRIMIIKKASKQQLKIEGEC